MSKEWWADPVRNEREASELARPIKWFGSWFWHQNLCPPANQSSVALILNSLKGTEHHRIHLTCRDIYPSRFCLPSPEYNGARCSKDKITFEETPQLYVFPEIIDQLLQIIHKNHFLFHPPTFSLCRRKENINAIVSGWGVALACIVS